MSKSETATALNAELKAIEEQAKAEAETEGDEHPADQNWLDVDATDPARRYAHDFGVDLAEVKGTGKDGRILVMDVEAAKKEMEARAEAEAEQEDAGEAEEAEQPKVEINPKAREIVRDPRRGLFTRSVMPTLKPGIQKVWHIHRALAEFGMGDWDHNVVVSSAEANEGIGKHLANGWVLMHIQYLSVDSDGVHMLWVLGLPEEGYEDDWPYREVHHMVRRIGAFGDDGRGVTHLAANQLVKARLAEGWDLAYVTSLGISVQDGGLNMLWVFLR